MRDARDVILRLTKEIADNRMRIRPNGPAFGAA